MSDRPPRDDDPQDDPFAGLLRKRRLNPELGVPEVTFNSHEGDEGGPPAPESRSGYVREDDVDIGLNVRIPRWLHRNAKRAALNRGMSLTAYIALLIERDTGR